ncbi:MAG: hypothetical protein JO290_11230 [Sphingomonadaceae bacterium]|nr:hypothetical protein [Sphingomonadaceae bacterium]MBV9098016.1 hypothetical protein [Frankiaceae bacterium]
MRLLLAAAIAAGASAPLPVINHSASRMYHARSATVLFCTQAGGLPLARIASARARTDSRLSAISDKIAGNAGCIPALGTTPFPVDFVEDVRWSGAVLDDEPMQSGVERVARGRNDLGPLGDYYFYVAVRDIVPATGQ